MTPFAPSIRAVPKRAWATTRTPCPRQLRRAVPAPALDHQVDVSQRTSQEVVAHRSPDQIDRDVAVVGEAQHALHQRPLTGRQRVEDGDAGHRPRRAGRSPRG
jgi:hypothetical protein